MNASALTSIVCLAFVAMACLVATLHPRYRENWLEFLGMMVVCFWCVSRISIVWERGYTLPENLMLHCGLAVFAAGALVRGAHKVRLSDMRWPGLVGPADLDRQQMRHVRGRGKW